MSLRLIVSRPPEWMDSALCTQTDPETFHPLPGGSPRQAKRICARCPVTDECLQYALDRREPNGVWGGKTAEERRALTRRAGRQVAA